LPEGGELHPSSAASSYYQKTTPEPANPLARRSVLANAVQRWEDDVIGDLTV
jgi:hypothetical protein